ncbi:MAG: TlpA disulfide reductase family protein [Schleiferiaceae bacterium]|nr:TlpA disulfide reductase family protein [Schleiferiaceae bacterium]
MKWIKKPTTLLLIAALSLGALAFAERITDKADERNKPVEIGQKAPDIALEDPEGNVRKLSDLRGKVVLIDFWASWCRPCRMENPHVVKLYKKYKDQEFKYGDGFTVYSVSLDRNKQDWTKAIEQDGLIWPNHVSDLKMWNSQAAAGYNITAIPATYLIDEDGIVLARNLRGQALKNALAKMAK